MEIELLIRKKKEIYTSLMKFIDDTENTDIDPFIKNIEEKEMLKNKNEISLTLQLLSKIADNHHCLPDFIDKLVKIINYIIQEIRSEISDYEIYKIFKNNKHILLFLLEQRFIQPDEQIILDIKKTKDKNNFPYSFFLYSGIKLFIDEKEIKKIEKEIKEKYGYEINDFEEKCRIGENDSYICSLIRQDSAEEFISYVNRTKTSLSSQIQPSIFETNLFLMHKTPTLIEYATFFGSIQIVQYLRYSNVPLTNSLWLYAIHSNNAEIIHFLEENEIKPGVNCDKRYGFSRYQQSITYEKIFEESIICHHNAIAEYIRDNYLNSKQIDCFGKCIINCFNYHYFPLDFGYIISNSVCNNGFRISQICFSLTSIGKYSFYKRSSLTKISIPSSVTSIGDYAFNECSSLIQITIPSSVISIGKFAFSFCSSLTQITIPSSVTSIGDSAFSGCSSLTQITIPSSVTSIGTSFLSGCIKLDKITVFQCKEKWIDYFENKFLIYKTKSELYNTLIWAKPTINTVIIPAFINSIGEGVFKKCLSLTQITIPSSVTSIGESAFDGCSSLTQITIPSSVTSFGNKAFNGVRSLIITGNIQKITNNMFEGCSSLTQITIPSSVTSIGNNAFCECSSLTQITIPSSVTSIGENAFNECSSLTQITIPSSVTSIGKYAFSGCFSLTQITIPSSVTSIGYYAFNGVRSLIITGNIQKITNHMFEICLSLTQITIPSSVTSIGNNAFCECSSLTQITIPSSVTSIGKFSFSGCLSLTKITIPSSVTSIGYFAFKGCSRLTQITIPSSVTSIGNSAFSFCSSLTQIIIPSSVTSIGNGAFSFCSRLTQITIPSSVTSIGKNAFSKCSSLTQISIPSSVTSIGESAFKGCSSLTQITIPSSINTEYIGLNSSTIINTI